MNQQLESAISTRLSDFHNGRINCAEAVLITMCDYYGIDMEGCPMIATPFGGGMCSRQGVCGAVSGALMVIGLKHGRKVGGNRAPAYALGQAFMNWFEEAQGSLQCRDLVQCDFTDPEARRHFRDPGGLHEGVCEPLVAAACRWLAEHL